jgi:hypothetical protein
VTVVVPDSALPCLEVAHPPSRKQTASRASAAALKRPNRCPTRGGTGLLHRAGFVRRLSLAHQTVLLPILQTLQLIGFGGSGFLAMRRVSAASYVGSIARRGLALRLMPSGPGPGPRGRHREVASRAKPAPAASVPDRLETTQGSAIAIPLSS